MLRANSLARLHEKRTLRGVYIWHQATPYACFVDRTALGTAIVVPGMVATKTTGEQVTRSDATADVPFGLFANYIGGTMDELGGGTEVGVYRGGPDATFEVLAGPDSTETPLDAGVTWTTLNATAGGVALYSNATGQLTNVAGSAIICARLVEAVSNSKIIITLDLRTA